MECDERLPALCFGPLERAEFHAAFAGLRSTTALTICRDAETALAALASGYAPQWIIAATPLPGYWPAPALAALQQAAPLAPLVMLLGTWCEGETRSGRPFPGAVRVAWYDWASAWREQWAARAEGRTPSWFLPATATTEERLLAEAPSLPHRGDATVKAAATILSDDHETARWLAEVCQRLGFTTATLPPGAFRRAGDFRVVLFDADELGAAAQQRIATLAGMPQRPRIIAMAEFPRIADYRAALRAGAACVLPKPVSLAALEQALTGRN